MCVCVEQVQRGGLEVGDKIREQLGSSFTFHSGLALAMTLSLHTRVCLCTNVSNSCLISYATHCLPTRPTTDSQTNTYSPVSTH